MSRLVYTVHVEPMPNGGFYITVPALPECRTTAKTFNTAVKKSKAEIEKHLKKLAKSRKPVPIESQTIRPICMPIRVALPRTAKPVLASEL